MPYEVLPEKQYCPGCKQDKPIKEFKYEFNKKYQKWYVGSQCKECLGQNKYMKEYDKKRADDRVEYDAWKSMKRRCYDPKDDSYENYGKRGIKLGIVTGKQQQVS